jgi:hypothetical protein
MSKIKNQHYVPKFYLKNFLNSSGKIFVFDKSTGKIFGTNVENVANENYFYDISELDEKTGIDQFLEKHFHPLETKISELLKKLIDELRSKTFKKYNKVNKGRAINIFYLSAFENT